MLRRSSQQPEWVKMLLQEMLKPPQFLEGIMEDAKGQKKQSQEHKKAPGQQQESPGQQTTQDTGGDMATHTKPRSSAGAKTDTRPGSGTTWWSANSAGVQPTSSTGNVANDPVGDKRTAALKRPRRTTKLRPTSPMSKRENHIEEVDAEDWVPTALSQTDHGKVTASGSDWQSVLRQSGIPPAVAKQYGWKVTSAVPHQNVMKVTTATGGYALKRADMQAERIVFLSDAEKHLRQHGVTHVARFAVTKQKQPYVRRGSEVFYATRWIEGRPVRFSSQQDVEKTARALAEFHEASLGFESSLYNPPMEFNLKQMFKRRYEDLKILLAQADAKTNKGTFDKLFLSMEQRLRQDADRSLVLFDDPDSNDFLLHEEFQPGLCHLDVIPSNFIYDKTDNVQLLDLDLATYAPRVLDLSHLLRRSLQVQNWNTEVAYVCFLNFDKVRPIAKEEYALVEAILRFPYRAWRLANTRYRVFAESGQVSALKRYQNQEDSRQQFLRELQQQIH